MNQHRPILTRTDMKDRLTHENRFRDVVKSLSQLDPFVVHESRFNLSTEFLFGIVAKEGTPGTKLSHVPYKPFKFT